MRRSERVRMTGIKRARKSRRVLRECMENCEGKALYISMVRIFGEEVYEGWCEGLTESKVRGSEGK